MSCWPEAIERHAFRNASVPVAQKASTRVMILYWYDIQGRVIANDLLSRLYLLNGRIRNGRNDGQTDRHT